MKIVKTLITIMVATAVGAGAFWAVQSQPWRSIPASAGKTSFDLSVLKESMEKNNELSTAKYLYTASVVVKDQNTLASIGFKDIVIPFSDAIYITEFDGTIKAGYNLDDASVEMEGGDTVVISLPPAKILSHETGQVRLVHEQQNILNPMHASQESEWLEEQKVEMEKRAEELGLFEEAQQNAKVTFESLFAPAIPEDAKVEVRFEK